MGLERFELSTPRLSSVCSNQLSYRPRLMIYFQTLTASCHGACQSLKAEQQYREERILENDQTRKNPKVLPCIQKGGDPAAGSPTATLLRLHPSHQLHLRPLPPLRVGPRASGVSGFRGVTGGVYKARERIHRGVADPRLLATPTSCRRVSACNPN